MTARAHISLKTKLASALLALGDVPYDHAKLMTPDQIISLYHFDHGILHGIKPVNDFWNLTPRLIGQHRAKSAIDNGIVAKMKRITGETCTGPTRAIPARVDPWPKGRKLHSRGFR